MAMRYVMGIAMLACGVAHAVVQRINTATEFDSILKNNDFVIAEFSADWCHPCKITDPIFEKFSEEFRSITFLKIDIEKIEVLANRYNINEMPAFLYFKNGKELARHAGSRVKTGRVGFIDEESISLDEGIRQYIAKYFGIANDDGQITSPTEKKGEGILERIKKFFTSLFS